MAFQSVRNIQDTTVGKNFRRQLIEFETNRQVHKTYCIQADRSIKGGLVVPIVRFKSHEMLFVLAKCQGNSSLLVNVAP